MEERPVRFETHIPAAEKPSSDRWKQWMSLLFWLSLIPLFMFVVGPMGEKLPLVRPVAQFIEERGIDAGAVYYTDIEQFSVAAIQMENTMDYLPRGQ